MLSPAALDPVARDFLARSAAAGGKALANMQIDEARAFMQAGQWMLYSHPALSTEVISIAGTPVRVVRGAAASPAVVLYLHGGGWVLGSSETHAGIVQEIALRTGAAVLAPDYSLAPEYPFPAALEQCYAIARDIQAGASVPDLDGSRLAIVGDSAGGNLAAAVALLASERDGLDIRLQVLVCPAFSPEPATQSYSEFGEGFGLTAADMRWFWDQYVADAGYWSDWRLSPLQAPQRLLSKAPPALILTAGCDVLRDEAEMYAHQLWSAGGAATLVRFPGMIHNFPVIDELHDSGSTQSALALIASALTDALRSGEAETGLSSGRINRA